MFRSSKLSTLLVAMSVTAASARFFSADASAQIVIERGPEEPGGGNGGGTTIPGDGDSNWENTKKLAKKIWRGAKGIFSGSNKPWPPPDESVANALQNANQRNSASSRLPPMPVVQPPKFRVSDNLELSFDTEPLKQSLVELVNKKFSGAKPEGGARPSRLNPAPVQASSASWRPAPAAPRSHASGLPATIGSYFVFDLNAHQYLSFNSSSRRLELATGDAVRFGLAEVHAPEWTEISMVNTIPSMAGGQSYAGKKVMAKTESEGAATAPGRLFLRPLDEHGAYIGFVAIDDRGTLMFHEELPYVTRDRVYYEKGSVPDHTGLYRDYEGWFKEVRRVVDDKQFGRYAFALEGGALGLKLTSGHKTGVVLHPTLGSNAKIFDEKARKWVVAPPQGPANFLFLEPDGLGPPGAKVEYAREGVLLHSQSLRFLNAEKSIQKSGETVWRPRVSYAMFESRWNQPRTEYGHPTVVAAPEAAFLRIHVVKDDGQQRLICCIENPASGRWLGEQVPEAPGAPRRVDASKRKGFIWVFPSKTMPGHWEQARYDSAGNLVVGIEQPTPTPQFIDLAHASEKEWEHCMFEIIGVGEHVALLHLASNRLLRCSTPPTPRSPSSRYVHESLSLEWGEPKLPDDGGQWDPYMFRFAVPLGPK